MWEKVQDDIAILNKELGAALHATGVRRYSPDLYNLENGEDKEILESLGFVDIYRLEKEQQDNLSKNKAEQIFEYLIQEQKKCSNGRIFPLKTKDVCDLFGIKSRSLAIDWMERTKKMFSEKVVMQRMKGGSNGYWIMTLTDDEISKLNLVR